MAGRRTGSASKGTLYHVRVEISETGFSAKFESPRGAGVGLARFNPYYYETIGRWFCREVEAGRMLPSGEIELNP